MEQRFSEGCFNERQTNWFHTIKTRVSLRTQPQFGPFFNIFHSDPHTFTFHSLSSFVPLLYHFHPMCVISLLFS